MEQVIQGIPGAPGIAVAPAHVVRWPRFDVPHATIAPDHVATEIERFHAGREAAKRNTSELRRRVEERLGPVQAKIFDPQLLMLEDPELIDGTLTYIRDSYLKAERAFSLRVLEFRSRWLDAPHARVVDRIADLSDVSARVLAALRGDSTPGGFHDLPETPIVLVTDELTPSRLVEIEPDRVAGIASDTGTRTSHAAILARSCGIPTVVGLGDLTRRITTGTPLLLDGYRGRAIIDPAEHQRQWYADQARSARESTAAERIGADQEPVTREGIRITLQANLELPEDATEAAAAGADGVGLFRTEFLVIGKTAVPDEEEQLAAFRGVVEAFAPAPVVIRTYDLGGDKFPIFLPPLAEENPFLGWRGIRIYEELPGLFRNQVRAALRAAALGNVRMLLPMVNTVEEVLAAREVIQTAARDLEAEGVPYRVPALGIMLETPAAIAITEVLGRHVDFFSLGTNDLVQYVLAVDRSNARLAQHYDLYHPGVLRFIRDAVRAAGRLDVPLSLCGESASDPAAAFLMLGLGVRVLSCSPSVIPEMKGFIRSISVEEAEAAAADALTAETGTQVRQILAEALGSRVDLPEVAAITSLSRHL